MREYDVALKNLLTSASSRLLTTLTGLKVAVWHNAELPVVQARQPDLLGETARGELVHVELQSTNDPTMAERMLKYSVAIHEKFGRYPHQLVLYVGRNPLKMPREVEGPGLEFGCPMIDIREIESTDLLASSSLEDNVLAVLARFQDGIQIVREILRRIHADGAHRESALTELTILAGLRKLGPIIKEELLRMPILEDIMDHDLIGPAIRQGISQGIEDGERRMVLRMLESRFGILPPRIKEKVARLSIEELEDLGVQLMNASSLEQLFG